MITKFNSKLEKAMCILLGTLTVLFGVAMLFSSDFAKFFAPYGIAVVTIMLVTLLEPIKKAIENTKSSDLSLVLWVVGSMSMGFATLIFSDYAVYLNVVVIVMLAVTTLTFFIIRDIMPIFFAPVVAFAIFMNRVAEFLVIFNLLLLLGAMINHKFVNKQIGDKMQLNKIGGD